MKSKRRCEGFTLTELMVTVGIVAVVSSLAFTGYHSFMKAHNLTQSVYMLSQDLEAVRERALSLGIDHVVIFDEENGIYRAFRRDTMILDRRLKNGVSFSLLTGVSEPACDCSDSSLVPVTFPGDTLTFWGRGAATPGCVYISDGKRQMAIYVNPLGKVGVCSFFGGVWHE
jgi:prepilin-type N-terminal cleavage/methylation domain-containing protein